jgi:formiminotetrahydrofolate cyclodeaminase
MLASEIVPPGGGLPWAAAAIVAASLYIMVWDS